MNKEYQTGLILLIATMTALIISNASPELYDAIIHYTVSLGANSFEFNKSLYFWINDGLMAIFFLMVGLELKRELLSGHLSEKSTAILPVIGAFGGILIPVIIFCLFNYNSTTHLEGWAIPAATDIVFALAILSLCSKNVPAWAKVFLLGLAVFDDLVAIIIIAFFYTKTLSSIYLLLSVFFILILGIMNYIKIQKMPLYLLIGFLLWGCVLKSGVHATLAGVITAFLIPYNKYSERLEHQLTSPVSFIILPLFTFANTGIDFKELLSYGLFNPVTIGSSLGLFLGKQLGVFSFVTLYIKLFKGKIPKGFDYKILYGVSILCGIGFTMSIFIASLAYADNYIELVLQARIGILIGSFLSAVIGYMYLRHQFKEISTEQ